MKPIRSITLISAIILTSQLCLSQQRNFAISNEAIDQHQAEFDQFGMPTEGDRVTYIRTIENLSNASTATLFGAFLDWYGASSSDGGFMHTTQESYDQTRGWEEVELIWKFRFWNKASYKAVSVKSIFRFYAKEGRARVVHERFLLNLSELDLLTPAIVKSVRTVTRAADRTKSNDPNYPYTIEQLELEKAESTMKARLIVAFDLANRMLVEDLENYLRNYIKKLEESDDW